ncbi:Imm30 family immunity protein [Pseudobutyrivibrio sp. MD2005]|uniref:Imm30 family immunity protein n=1 Tax=Pseudobutyrivibrio sp. MD2005 TaxID=1410616 RepID=UPI0006871361|nr:Imm30 family immunity protein [Pseudobutyrivibrio sp. MD2005]
MKDEIFKNLYNNRMLRNSTEIEKYENNLNLLSENFSEEDIINLCLTFEDKTHNTEVMFGAIHLLESLSSEVAYENTIIGIIKMYVSAPEWANIITYRILNDEFSVKMVKSIYNRMEKNISAKFKGILEAIKQDDCEKFGNSISIILG